MLSSQYSGEEFNLIMNEFGYDSTFSTTEFQKILSWFPAFCGESKDTSIEEGETLTPSDTCRREMFVLIFTALLGEINTSEAGNTMTRVYPTYSRESEFW